MSRPIKKAKAAASLAHGIEGLRAASSFWRSTNGPFINMANFSRSGAICALVNARANNRPTQSPCYRQSYHSRLRRPREARGVDARDGVSEARFLVAAFLPPLCPRRRKLSSGMDVTRHVTATGRFANLHRASTAKISAHDTIFALSTPSGSSAIAVIRVSGPASENALRELLASREAIGGDDGGDYVEEHIAGRAGGNLTRCRLPSTRSRLRSSLPPPRRLVVREIIDPQTGSPLDKCVVLWLPGPSTFTGEDMFELHVHGGPAVVGETLAALSRLDKLREARPGEFTRIAFGNGKLDLSEVEGIGKLVQAQTARQRELGLRLARGDVRRLCDGWREDLVRALALVESLIDFAEDEPIDEDNTLWVDTVAIIASVIADMQSHTRMTKVQELVGDGLTMAVLGPPNVGKSSLFNRLIKRDAAITSHIAGTTRDVVQAHVDFAGVKMTLCDTAGVRTTLDPVEAEGVQRAIQTSNEADVTIFVVDAASISLIQEPAAKDNTSTTSSSPYGDISHQSIPSSTQRQTWRLIIEDELLPGVDIFAPGMVLVVNKTDSVDLSFATAPTQLESDSNCDKRPLISSIQTRDGRVVSLRRGGDWGNLQGDRVAESIVVWTSCVTLDGIADLTDMIDNRVKIMLESGGKNAESLSLLASRHQLAIEKACQALAHVEALFDAPEVAAHEIRESLSHLAEVSGSTSNEEILDTIFRTFCLGKRSAQWSWPQEKGTVVVAVGESCPGEVCFCTVPPPNRVTQAVPAPSLVTGLAAILVKHCAVPGCQAFIMGDDDGWTTVTRRGRRRRAPKHGVAACASAHSWGVQLRGQAEASGAVEPINRPAVERWISAARRDMEQAAFSSEMADLAHLALLLGKGLVKSPNGASYGDGAGGNTVAKGNGTDSTPAPGHVARASSDLYQKLVASVPRDGTEVFDIVCYGLGSIACSGVARHQLALLCFIGDVHARKGWSSCPPQVYDPVLGDEEKQILGGMGLHCLEINEACKRVAKVPTLFIMPHCDKVFYENLLSTNVEAGTIGNVVIIGNSFDSYALRGDRDATLETGKKLWDSGDGLSASKSSNPASVIAALSSTMFELQPTASYRARDDAFNDVSVHSFLTATAPLP